MSVKIRSFLTFFLLAGLYGGYMADSGATHISKPILVESKTEYRLGEKIVLSGWVSYQDQPAADVLLNAKVLRPDSTEIREEFFMSDKRGNFKFEFETINLLPGKYLIIITSQCLEAHRPVCTFQSETLTTHLTE